LGVHLVHSIATPPAFKSVICLLTAAGAFGLQQDASRRSAHKEDSWKVTAMKRRFSAQHLYRLRNLIPIDVLIAENLSIPCRQSQGHLRFLCPLCRQFQTATMQKTNLARCFRCEQNFNTIDLVMLWQNTDFVQSVKFLTAVLQNLAGRKHCLSKAPTEAIGIGQVLRTLLCQPPAR
jgi:hypothetical protein